MTEYANSAVEAGEPDRPSAPGRAEAFFRLAAGIFGVDRDTISAETSRDSFVAWDSINHIRLVMESEPLLGVSFPLEKIPELKRLGDFL